MTEILLSVIQEADEIINALYNSDHNQLRQLESTHHDLNQIDKMLDDNLNQNKS